MAIETTYKIFKFFTLLIVLCFVPVNAETVAKRDYTVAIDRDYAPFTFVDKEGKPAGLFVDLWRAWAKELNVSVAFHFYDWQGTLDAVKEGRVDFHSGTSKDYAWMYASDPIYRIEAALFTRKGIVLKTPLDINNKDIGAIDAYYAQAVLKTCMHRCRVHIYPTYAALVSALREKKVDAVIEDIEGLNYYLLTHGGYGEIHKAALPIKGLEDEVYAIVNAAHRDLLPIINRGLKRIDKETLLRIEEHWLANPQSGYWHLRIMREHDGIGALLLRILLALVLTALAVAAWYLWRMRHYKSEAILDPLTGLYNRRAFDRFYRKQGERIALALIDIDYFKQYNDGYGHDEGDKLLKEIGDLLRGVAGEYDFIVYRIGGDEFAAVGYDKDQSAVRSFIDEIIRRLREKKITHAGNPHGIATVTVGASYGPHTLSHELLFRCSDRNLYRAKEKGRNTYELSYCDEASASQSKANS